jgi:hypothetical protein
VQIGTEKLKSGRVIRAVNGRLREGRGTGPKKTANTSYFRK